MKRKSKGFDYQAKVWGELPVRLSPTYLAYLRLRYCLAALEPIEGRVLDVGCGGGGFAKSIKFYRPDLEVHGVDISKQAIEIAKEDPRGVVFRAGDANDLPYNDSFFEAVVFGELLEHIENPQQALQEIARVLKPRGLLHAIIPLEGEPFTLLYWLEKLGWRGTERFAGHIQQFRVSQLEEMLEASGLEVIEKRYARHCLTQLIDACFYSLLYLRGKELPTGLERYLAEKPGLLAKLAGVAKSVLTSITNLESLIFSFLPAGEVYLLCRKKAFRE